MRRDFSKFAEREAVVVVLGPEEASEFQEYWQDHDLPFIGLPDPEQVVLDRYGQGFNLIMLGRMPAQAVVDKQGIVRYAHYGMSMMDIPPNEELLDLLDELNREIEQDAAVSKSS